MIGAILAVFLQLAAAPATPVAEPSAAAATEEAPASQEAPARVIPAGMMECMMECRYDRATRVRNCTNSDGEVLRCRRERQLGSRFYTWVCLTHAEDQQIQSDTQQQIDRQQRISTPGGG
jgi:hypothetical protein